MANINPTPDEVAGKVGDLRLAFKQNNANDIINNKYDKRDMDRLDEDDAYARCFLRTLKSKGDVNKAAEVASDCFKFRKEIGIWEFKDDTFPKKELWDMKGIYYQGKDKEGHPILYFKVKLNNPKDKAESQMLKNFIAYQFELHHRAHPEEMCVVLFDMSGASTSNVNLDVTKYVISCFTHYFPTFLAYLLNYEMPMLVGATWSVVTTFLSKEQQKKMIKCTKKDIGKYIPEEHLWEHMK